MRTIKKFREGDTIPEGARYLRSAEERDHANATQRWEPTEGIMGSLPIFGTQTLYRYTPIITVHYYEVDV